MSNFTFKPATRTGVKPLVGFYGPSGCGKTLSALYYARGIVGPKGKIALIDTESGRGSLFADIVPNGYEVVEMSPPFGPDNYIEAIEAAETYAGPMGVIVIDSMTHEWAGEGGVLDMQEEELTRMAGQDYGKREACKMASWGKPKMAHKKMVMRLLRTKCAIICCLRGDDKVHMEKVEGKNKVIKDDFSSPIFDPRFIFELTVNFEMYAKDGEGGFVIPRKITHPSIRALLPKPDEQIGITHGAALAEWCLGKPAAAPTTQPAVKSEYDIAKDELWAVCKGELTDKTAAGWLAWLKAQALVDVDFTLKGATPEQLRAITTAAKGKVKV